MGNNLSGTTQLIDIMQQVATSQSLSSQNLQELQTYVQQAQQNLYNDVTGKKDAAMASAYGELKANTNALHGLQYYLKRNKQLNKVQEDIAGTVKAQASAVEEDQNLAKRQNEINEWEAGNKRDTLFIYQLMLVGLSLTIILAYLMRIGILGSYMFYGLMLIVLVVVIFTIANRAQYTQSIRDRRFWNKRRFPTDTTPINSSLCLDLNSETGPALTDLSGNTIGSTDMGSNGLTSMMGTMSL
jgi:cation transport ATPase